MAGSLNQLVRALKPLGDPKYSGSQLKYDCPRCLKAGSGEGKTNLEVQSTGTQVFHCWACNYKGHISKLIKDYGYKEYLELFSTQQELDPLEKSQIFELPKYIQNVLNNKEATDYLLSRGLSKIKIRERDIRFCYAGELKNRIIFPSYNENGELTCFITHHLKTKKYSVRKKENFICFHQNFIDKRMPIILTEGIYDALVVPNAIPILGTTLSTELLAFLSNTTVLLAVDNDLALSVKKKMQKALKTVCKNFHTCIFSTKYKDINETFLKDKLGLITNLHQFYLVTQPDIYDHTS